MIKPNVGENYHKRSELEVRVRNMPGSWAQREKKMRVFVLIRGTEDIHQALQLGYWERGGGSDSQLQLHLFPSGTSTEKRERNTHKHSVSESEGGREGGMERDTTGSLLSLKGKACKKWNSCPDSVTMDPCCSRSDLYSVLWFLCEKREDGQFIHVVLIHLERAKSCRASVGLQKLDD